MSQKNPKQNKKSQRPGKKSRQRHRALDPHQQRESEKYAQPIPSREYIREVLRREAGPMDYEALAEVLGLMGDDVAMEALRRRVSAMIRDGQLIRNRRRGLVPVDDQQLLAGRISAHPDGFGFVLVDDGDKDIFLNARQMRRVLHGDRVVVSITGVDRRGRREGRIVEVVERANHSVVGRVVVERGIAMLNADNKRIHQDVLIASGELNGAGDGDMVVAEIIEQPTERNRPVGRVTEVLGQHLQAGMEIDVALHSHGIPAQWPDEVSAEAAAFSTEVEPALAMDRRDVRDLPLITIDGADARDFDDAVWCESLEQGWRVIVAIADVAHYVTPGSALDAEAVKRGTSVYFPGRVVPMLPEVLSNGLCSLNPHVDRLCMLCEMTLDADGHVKKTRFHNGIMRSHARLTYDQVHEMLTQNTSALRSAHADLLPMIEQLHVLYQTLAARRSERGAIEFESNETYIVFDDDKKISDIRPLVRNDAHRLIEELMILANIQAAACLEERDIPALYRVHAGPKSDRLDDLRAFLKLRGLTLDGGTSPDAKDYAVLSRSIAERSDRGVIQTMMLRSMQQAVYQPANEGHFGLALDQYAHFTSPIRRYPDLLVHRALKHVIARGQPARFPVTAEAMAALGASCSMTERRAEEASRDVVAWLKCEYMQERVGEHFDGVISAVTSFGLFVELSSVRIEGLLHITNLSRDYYHYDSAAQALIGEHTGKRYNLGDAITVQVTAVNLEERKIDFGELVGKRKKRKHKRRQKTSEAVSQSQVAISTPDNEQPSVTDPLPVTVNEQPDVPDSIPVVVSEQSRVPDPVPATVKEPKANELLPSGQPADRSVDDTQPELPVQVETVVVDSVHEDSREGMEADTHTSQPVESEASSSDVANKVTSKKAIAEKATAKKATAKKATAKKATAKKATAKKATAKKATAKKATAKKATAKKATAKKATVKKATAKKATAKKATAKKATAKKATAKKATAKKATAKKATANRAIAKKAIAKKATANRAIAKKAIAKKATGTKATAKKATAKKATAKKATANRAIAKKAIAKKATAKKATTKKAIARKATAKKTSRRKAP